MKDAELMVGVTGLCLQFSTLVWTAASCIASAAGTRIANALGRVSERVLMHVCSGSFADACMRVADV